MSPIRIIIIAILIYIAYRLITGGGRKSTAERDRQRAARQMPSSDTLEEDPICKKLVPRQQAVQYEHQGTMHYFCSKECCKLFRTKLGEHK